MGVKRYTNQEWESGQADKSAARDKRLTFWTYTLAELWALKMLLTAAFALSTLGRERFYELTGWAYVVFIPLLLIMALRLRHLYQGFVQQPMPPRWRW